MTAPSSKAKCNHLVGIIDIHFKGKNEMSISPTQFVTYCLPESQLVEVGKNSCLNIQLLPFTWFEMESCVVAQGSGERRSHVNQTLIHSHHVWITWQNVR
jgi:hypothetical protein